MSLINRLMLVFAITLLGCTEANEPTATLVNLQLTLVDGKPLPFTVGTLGGASTETVVTAGVMTGNSIGPSCQITLALQGGGQIIKSITECTINRGDVINLPMDLGSSTGIHTYRFQ